MRKKNLLYYSDFYPIFMIFIIKYFMGRPKLKIEERKGKLGICLSKELIIKINKETNNKSTFIENLIDDYFKKVNYGN